MKKGEGEEKYRNDELILLILRNRDLSKSGYCW